MWLLSAQFLVVAVEEMSGSFIDVYGVDGEFTLHEA
jgi:hypothetical protein